MQMYTMDLPSRPDVLAAIGEVAVRHGQLDLVLRRLVHTLTSMDIQETDAATEGMGSAELRDHVKVVARKAIGKGEPYLKLCALLTRAKVATQHRNALLHGVWGAGLDDGETVVRRADGAFGPPPSVADLKALADELAHITFDINTARRSGFIFVEQAARAAAQEGGPRNDAG